MCLYRMSIICIDWRYLPYADIHVYSYCSDGIYVSLLPPSYHCLLDDCFTAVHGNKNHYNLTFILQPSKMLSQYLSLHGVRLVHILFVVTVKEHLGTRWWTYTYFSFKYILTVCRLIMSVSSILRWSLSYGVKATVDSNVNRSKFFLLLNLSFLKLSLSPFHDCLPDDIQAAGDTVKSVFE